MNATTADANVDAPPPPRCGGGGGGAPFGDDGDGGYM